VLGLFGKPFEFLGTEMVVKLFKTLVCPILEYSNSIWGLNFILDQRKIENIQCRTLVLFISLKVILFLRDCYSGLTIYAL